MVTVRPNFQDSVHVGLVTGLKKFTQYLTSVLCFTTPGDGPRSPARAVRTHEDGGWLRVATETSCGPHLFIIHADLLGGVRGALMTAAGQEAANWDVPLEIISLRKVKLPQMFLSADSFAGN